MFLSHSTYRKRVKQEFTRICQAKRAKLLSDVRSAMQENRALLQKLAKEREERPAPAVKPLPPEPCVGMELLRSVSVSFTNSSGKTTYIKVSLRPQTQLCPYSPTLSLSSGSTLTHSSHSGPSSLQHVVLNTTELSGGGRDCAP